MNYKRRDVIIASVVVLLAIGVYTWRNVDLNFQIAKTLIGDAPPEDEMYPPSPKDLPACTASPLPQLLADYERVLTELGVDTGQCLQEGLTDQELDALERQYSCKFSQDIRDLYKWHNGTPASSSVEIFPLGKFLPLDDSLEFKNRPHEDHRDPKVQEFMDDWMAFRKSWIEITSDGAGNGHYYDPDRINHSSSFFYHAHDDVPYDFYPCVGNWIQSLLDLHSRGRLAYEDGWIQWTGSESYDEEAEFFSHYGTRVESY